MRDMRDCFLRAEIQDLSFRGVSFTWINNRPPGLISKKLDRILVNDKWMLEFPNYIGIFGEVDISDHSPCCLFLDSMKAKRKRPFMFMNHLLKSEDFLKLIEVCWSSLDFAGTKIFSLSRKLKEMKGIIRKFNRLHFS